jgi:hypothetical protein
VDGAGNPLSGVTVQITGNQAATATTASDGQFIVAGLASSIYSVVLSKSGYTSVSASVTVVAGQTASIGDLVLVIGSSTTGLQGTVRNGSTGAPVAGATISITGGPSTRSDANGRYLVAGALAGAYTVSVTMTGFDTLTASGTLIAGVSSLFSPSIYPSGTTPTTAALQGHVVDAATQQPIGGATVNVGTTSATSDSTGAFALSVNRSEFSGDFRV